MAKRALCVGINDYPGTEMDLAGCVNDARDWQALLESRGYTVTALHDSEAVCARLLSELKALVGGAAPGDSLVFTFSGHGSWLPDDGGDEADGRDEMMCAYDVMQDQFLLDDTLCEIFSARPARARLFVIADCCHSGSIVRHAATPHSGAHAATRARFLPPYVFARGNSTFDRALDRAARRPAAGTPRYPALLLSGCRDSEFSYDTSFDGRPNGALTRTAIDIVRADNPATPRALYDAIREKLPTKALPQTPQIFGSEAAQTGELF
jgi:hypothetical protein